MNMDISGTTAPKSDQQNFDDYIAGPRTWTITDVKAGTAEQPVEIHLAEAPGRPYKPSKSMRRVLVAAWGAEASAYIGRRITLYGDPEVKWAGQPVGGIRISHLSELAAPLKMSLTEKRGSRAPYVVQPLAAEAPKREVGKPIEERRAASLAAFGRVGVTPTQLEERVGKPQTEWAVADLLNLANVYTSITKDGAPVNQFFTAEADR